MYASRCVRGLLQGTRERGWSDLFPGFFSRVHGSGLAYLLYFAGTDAAGAGIDAHMHALRPYGLYTLNVRKRYLFGSVIGVAYLVSGKTALAAYCTGSCHVVNLRNQK